MAIKLPKKVLILSLFWAAFSSLSCFAIQTNQINEDELNQQSYKSIQQGNYHRSFELALQALKQSEQSNNQKERARSLSNMASSFFYLGEYTKALNLYEDSLKIAYEINDYEGIDRVLNNIPSIHNQLGDYEESIKYRKKQYKLSLERGSPSDQLTALIGLTRYHITRRQIEKAREFLLLTKAKLSEVNSDFLKIYVDLAESDVEALAGNVEHSINILKNSLSNSQKNDFKGLEVSLIESIARKYLLNNRLKLAEEFGLQSLSLSKSLSHQNKLLDSYVLLEDIYEKLGDFKNAYYYSTQVKTLEDDIKNSRVRTLAKITEVEKNIAETEEKLRVSRNEQKIAELKLEAQTQLQIIWTVSILIVFSLSFLWYYRKTSRQEIQRQKKVNEELKRLDKVKDRILTNTSHELRTPLNGIVGLSQVLLIENEDKLDEESLEHIKLIEKSGNQLSEIVDDILDLAKLRTHFISFKPKEFQLSPLINEVILTCRPLLKSEDVELNFGQPEKDISLFHDRTRIKQILLNLIGNAAKFTPSGSIDIKTKSVNGQILLKIQDTGIGIPKNMIGRVFEGFEQVDAGDSRENGGSGLGLAICSEIVKALNGRINLSSELGKGTIVEVQLPQKHQS